MATVGPGQSWRLIHNEVEVFDLFESAGITESGQQIFEGETRQKCLDEIKRLELKCDSCLKHQLVKGSGTISSNDFMDRFPMETQLSVASSSNPIVKLWYDKMLAAGEVDLSSDKLIDGLNALIDAGAITAEQARKSLSVGAQ
jgi:hypothetical protein